MSIHINILEAELEATRKKITKQLSMVGRSIQSIDPTLHEKERELEQAVIDAHDDVEPDTSNCKKCRVVIKNGGDWGYCTCCYEETRAQEEQDDEG